VKNLLFEEGPKAYLVSEPEESPPREDYRAPLALPEGDARRDSAEAPSLDAPSADFDPSTPAEDASPLGLASVGGEPTPPRADVPEPPPPPSPRVDEFATLLLRVLLNGDDAEETPGNPPLHRPERRHRLGDAASGDEGSNETDAARAPLLPPLLLASDDDHRVALDLDLESAARDLLPSPSGARASNANANANAALVSLLRVAAALRLGGGPGSEAWTRRRRMQRRRRALGFATAVSAAALVGAGAAAFFVPLVLMPSLDGRAFWDEIGRERRMPPT
jgi:hypothetical protein